jgi:hypothetical protein
MVSRVTAGVLLVAATLVVGLLFVLTPAAFADAAGPASCMGHEASSISPPGSSDEVPAGMRAFNAFFRENFPGTSPGSFVRTIAKLHEGSHADCDEAIEAALGG